MFGNLFNNVDPNIMILGVLFVIFFVVIQFALSKTFKEKGVSGIIAFCVSLLAVYGLSRTTLDFSGFFYGLGINENILYSVVPFILLLGLIYLFWKVKMRYLTTVLGIVLIIASFFVYEKTIILIIGVVLLLIGIVLLRREMKRRNRSTYLKHVPLQ